MADESSLSEQNTVREEELYGLHPGMTLKVMTLDNRLLFMGRIQGIQGSTVQISDDKGMKVPNIIYGTKIKLRGFYHSRPLTLEGEISGSTEQFWWLESIRSLQGSEQREYFRQSTDVEAYVMCANRIFGRGKQPVTDNEGRPVACEIADISAGGTMFSAKADFKVGDWLLLVNMGMMPDSPPFTFSCIVRRVTGEDDTKKFGCEFCNLTGKEREQLIRAIFACQRKEMEEHRNNSL